MPLVTLLTNSRGPDPEMVKKAKELCEDLMANVREQYEDFKSRPPRAYGGGGGGGSSGYGDRPHNTHHQGGSSYQGYNNNSHHHNKGNSYGNSPASAAP